MDIAFVSEDCTPPKGRAVASGGQMFPMNEEAQGKLLTRIALFKQGNQLACICCADQKLFLSQTADEIKEKIFKDSGISIENIMLVASHTHSVPDLVPVPLGISSEVLSDFSFVDEYSAELIKGISKARKKLQALNKWNFGTVGTRGWGICRRPLFGSEQGEVQAATQAPRNTDDFVGIDGRDENTLSALAAYGDNGIIGGFVNYACHPVTMYGSKFYSADFPGAFYESMDNKTSGVFLFANGPCGNVSPSCGGQEACRQIGEGIAECACDAISSGSESNPGDLRIMYKELNIARRKPTPDQLEYAREFNEKEPDELEITNFSYRMYGVKYHMGKNHPLSLAKGLCRQLLLLNEEIKNGIDSEKVRIQVIAVGGEIAFIGISAELFNQFTTLIQEQSPFKYNCIMGLANGWNGYIAPAESYKLGGYECCLSQISRLVPDAFDMIVDETVNLLERIKK